MQMGFEKDNSVLRFEGGEIVTSETEEDIIEASEIDVTEANREMVQPEFTGAVNKVNLDELD